MRSSISQSLRHLVAARADRLCEYCLIHEDDTFFGCEIDHIVSLKHGGATEEGNLAFACLPCNRHKGTDIGSIVAEGEFIRLFNSRQDRWFEHFRLEGPVIEPITDVGKVTISILQLHATERILEPETLIAIGRYPSEAAIKRMRA